MAVKSHRSLSFIVHAEWGQKSTTCFTYLHSWKQRIIRDMQICQECSCAAYT